MGSTRPQEVGAKALGLKFAAHIHRLNICAYYRLEVFGINGLYSAEYSIKFTG